MVTEVDWSRWRHGRSSDTLSPVVMCLQLLGPVMLFYGLCLAGEVPASLTSEDLEITVGMGGEPGGLGALVSVSLLARSSDFTGEGHSSPQDCLHFRPQL